MARNDRESRYPTFWQLEALEVVQRATTWDQATAELGRPRTQIERVVKALSDKLGFQKSLLRNIDGKPVVPPQYDKVVDQVRKVLLSYAVLEERARAPQLAFIVRVDGYWSHVENFLGRVIGEFDHDHHDANTRIELTPWYGAARDRGGAGLVADLLDDKVDLVIAPWDPALDPDTATGRIVATLWDPTDESTDNLAAQPLRYLPAYRWALCAAVPPASDIAAALTAGNDGYVDVSQLAFRSADYPLVTSPVGHATRAKLEHHQTASQRFHISTTSPEPAALVSLGATGDRVPIVPSDTNARRDPAWPLLTSRGATRRAERRLLGGAFALYWRETGYPEALPAILRSLAERIAVDAAVIDIGSLIADIELDDQIPPPGAWGVVERLRI